MNSDEIIRDLLASKSSFEDTLAGVNSCESAVLVVHLLEALDAIATIDNAERERRLKSVFQRVNLSPDQLVAVAEAGGRIGNQVLRNALAQLLPPELRPIVFRRIGAAASLSANPKVTVGAATLKEEPASAGASSEDVIPFSDVVILSLADDPATMRLLEGAEFVPLRCQSFEELDAMLQQNENICAFLVGSSFLKPLNETEQNALFIKLSRFSTFVFMRLHEDGLLADNTKIMETIAGARCRDNLAISALELSFRDSAALQEREIPQIRSAQIRLAEGSPTGLFVPGELNGSELNLLGAVMSQYAKERHFDPGAELTQVNTKFLQGGQSGARVALVKVNDLRVPVIVKLDNKAAILDEARRFLTFMHKDNEELRPQVHLHGKGALILFGIIPDSQNRPAPTLDQSLSDFWYSEMRDPVGGDDGAVLFEAFADAARRLAALNKSKCWRQDFECKANPYLVSLKHMETLGFDWELGQEALRTRDSAEKLVSDARDMAVCHGDAHIRNILVRGDQGFPIDYAYSGPGHPCSDLVRLELSVYFLKFVPLGNDAFLREFQRDLSDGMELPSLKLKYSGLFRSRINRVCIAMCVAARDLALQVLASHGLPREHYIASKILSAWQGLQVPSLQQALVRGVILSLSAGSR